MPAESQLFMIPWASHYERIDNVARRCRIILAATLLSTADASPAIGAELFAAPQGYIESAAKVLRAFSISRHSTAY